MTNEQIQALKAAENITEQLPAALEAWEKSNQGSVTLGWIHAANPVAVESLLAERDADKALIAEQAKRIAELEARTLTVKLPKTFWYEHDDLSSDVAVLEKRLVKKALREACVAAGITLVVGE